MNSKFNNLFRIFFAFTDLFILNFLNLILLKLSKDIPVNNFDYTLFCVFNSMVWFLCAYSTSLYINQKKFNNFNLFLKKTLTAFAILIAVDILFVHFKVFSDQPFVIRSLVSFFLFLSLSRLIFLALIKYIYKDQNYKKRAVFIGFNKTSRELAKHFENTNKISVEGFFDDDIKYNNHIIPILGKIDDCLDYAQKNKITEIYTVLSPKTYPFLYGLAQEAETCFIRFKFVPDLSEFADYNFHIDLIDGTAIISTRREPLESFASRLKKRVFDIFLSGVIVVFILSWLIPILAILVKWDSDGPVFFKQDRSGKNNLPFKCFKIRTLKINSMANLVQVTRDDERVTRIGRFLRKSNLDELPQFINVLMGDMSVVGSRPHMLKHTEDYSKEVDNYMVRHFIKPGVTGWAQVNGFRGEIKQREHLKQRVEHDIWYMENWDIWLDFRIVFLTFFSTIKGDKNAF